MSYFIVWRDYDGERLEKFTDEESSKVEARLTELSRRNKTMNRSDYGTHILGVIKGIEVEYEAVEVVSQIRLKNE